ncbi:ADP-ribose pyrophosphatase [Candidatus Norongarragalina meridionalis]|nr:ADP-ribose pyrophosphatase [Candidatus Norongarragalina meridionalis]
MRVRKAVQAVVKNGKMFLVVRKPDLRSGRLAWRLVKGGVEKGEAPERAMLRELKEETGLKGRVGKKLHSYKYPFAGLRHDVTVFLVIAKGKPRFLDGELCGSRWVSADKALRLLKWKDEKTAIRNALNA